MDNREPKVHDSDQVPASLPELGQNQFHRRQSLRIIGSAVIGIGSGMGMNLVTADDSKKPKAKDPIQDDALDEAYKILQKEEPSSRRGLSTHAPMAVEALCSLGFHEESLVWLQNHRHPLRELPQAKQKIDPQKWQEALGLNTKATGWEAANGRWGDWKELFIAELSEKKWQDVLNLWVPRLAPGIVGAATHGVIRATHAVRAYGRKQTPERLGEMARGLAYWASSYESFSHRERKKPPCKTFTEALEEVPLYREVLGKAPEAGNIAQVVRQMDQLKDFGEVRDAIGEPKDLSLSLSALTATFTRVYLRYGTKRDTIAFIHAVTGPASLRRLVPYIDPKIARDAFPYAWEAAAAIFSAYVPKRTEQKPEESKLTPEELAERAKKNGDEHAIKFTEVMLSEYQIQRDPIYLAAAEDATKRL